MARLEVRCVVDYGAFRLDAALDLEIRAVAVVFGPSGSGKTTLLRAIAGIEERTRGRIALGGEAWQDDAARVRRRAHRRGIGFVFQEARLFPHLTVEGNLRYGFGRTPPAERRLAFDHVVGTLGLGPILSRRPVGLSGGETQRVAIGRALLASPRLLLMDEPLASLDAVRRDEILALVESLPEEFGCPVLYVSHTIDEVLRIGTDLVLLSDGRVIAAGAIEEVLSRADLRPHTGLLDAGTILGAFAEEEDREGGLTRLRCGSLALLVPRTGIPKGAAVQVRIRARDVALALDPPSRTSVLNVFAGRIVSLGAEEDGQVDVGLDVGVPLTARITRKAVRELGLAVGREVHALVKAVAVDVRRRR